jgi:hypothetical protein
MFFPRPVTSMFGINPNCKLKDPLLGRVWAGALPEQMLELEYFGKFEAIFERSLRNAS